MSTVVFIIIKVRLTDVDWAEAMAGGRDWHIGLVGTWIRGGLGRVTAEETGEPL